MPSTASASPAYERMIRKLQHSSHLSAAEVEALRGLPVMIKVIGQDADIVQEGDRPTDCCLLVEGLLFRYKMMPDGARQILSLHVPGDVPDLQSLYLDVMDHNLGALAPSRVALIPHAAILEVVRRHPGVMAALWRETLVDGAIFREWLSNVGRHSAYQRMAHLMCEFFLKMKVVGLTEGEGCPFPLTQQQLGDALGLSVVHVNRTLQQLRAEGLLVLGSRHLSIPDFARMEQVAQFDRKYLHLSAR